MKLASLLNPEFIDVDIKATTFSDVISALLELIAEDKPGFDIKEVLGLVMERERLSPTIVDNGIAIPHARTDEVEDIIIAIGITHYGIKAELPDNEQPLKIFILILTPKSIPGYYLQTLAAVSRFIRMPGMADKILNAKDGNEVVDLFFDANITISRNLTVADIVNRDVITIKADATLRNAADLFFQHKISGLPVVGEGLVLLGEITDVDLLKFAMPNYQSLLANLAELPEAEPMEELLRNEEKIIVKKVMTSPMASVEPESSIAEVVALMLFKGARRVAVVDDGRLVGIISVRDIIDKIVRG